MFYTTEEAAALCGFLDGYLERDSVDAAVREKYEKFRLGLVQESLGRDDYIWATKALSFLRPHWWQDYEDQRARKRAAENADTGIENKKLTTIPAAAVSDCCCRLFYKGGNLISKETLKILVVEPMTPPTVQEIDGSLESMQKIVGGTIQAVYAFDEPVCIVCNDEGKLLGLPMNRALTDESGVPYDIVCGTFFVVGIGDENFTSLTEQQIEKYRKKYANEMVFSVPVPSGNHKKQCNKEKNKHER